MQISTKLLKNFFKVIIVFTVEKTNLLEKSFSEATQIVRESEIKLILGNF